MQWVGVVPHLLRHLIVDAQGVALIVIEMRLVVKVWDTNIELGNVGQCFIRARHY
jgi:hypothetical protein